MLQIAQLPVLSLPPSKTRFEPYAKHNDRMIVHVGYKDDGNPFYMDIQDKPHILITGNKNSGKTTLLHDIACSLLSTYTPQEVKIVLISNGKSGFSYYNNIPHLYSKVATEENTIISTLNSVLNDINNRKAENSENKRKTKVAVIVDDLNNLTIMGNLKALSKFIEIAKEGPQVGFHLIAATKLTGYHPIWNYLFNMIDAQITLNVSSSISNRILGSDIASKILYVGEGYAIVKNKPPLHFQSTKVHVQDIVKKYDDSKMQQQRLVQQYLQSQKEKRDFESLDPYQFEEYVAEKMRQNGYSQVSVTSKSGDYGADVLGVDESGNKVCVQCKQYTTKVGFDAVQQINTARTLFNCTRAILVTTSTVTKQARDAANQLHVELIENFTPASFMK